MKAISVWILVFVLTSVTYEAFSASCPASYKALGCFKDSKRRVLPHAIINERGKIPWNRYDNYLPSLICRCARKAREMGYRYFGIQFYGECWAGNSFTSRKKRKSCKDVEFNECPKNGFNRLCSGHRWTNFVYELQEHNAGHPALPQLKIAETTARPTTAVPTEPKWTIKCKVPLDIAFVVDASGSVGHRSFQLVKTFLKNFTHYFNVSSNETHFACLHYDHRVHPDFTFNDTQFYSSAALDAKLDSMTYPSGATLTDKALFEAKKFYEKDHGARDYHVIPRCVVILTDGRTWGGKSRLIQPAHHLKAEAHAKIVAIGVSWQVDREELKIMAGDRHYVLVETFKDLANAMHEVLDKVCT